MCMYSIILVPTLDAVYYPVVAADPLKSLTFGRRCSRGCTQVGSYSASSTRIPTIADHCKFLTQFSPSRRVLSGYHTIG